MDRDDELAMSLIAQLRRFTGTDPTVTPAVYLTVRSETGDVIGEIPMPAHSAEALTIAAMSTADYADMNPDGPDDALRIFDATVTDLHPDAVTELEDALAGVTADPDQIGVSDLHTQLRFQSLAADYISSRSQKFLVADIEDHFDTVDVRELSGDVLDNPAVAPLLVIEALDDVFGDVHDPYADDEDGEL